MERREMFTLMFLAAISVFLPKMESQVAPRPLCSSQLALVNYACSLLPTPYASSLSSSLNFSLDEHGNGNRNISGHENRHRDDVDGHDHDDDDNHRHHCRHRHHHHRCRHHHHHRRRRHRHHDQEHDDDDGHDDDDHDHDRRRSHRHHDEDHDHDDDDDHHHHGSPVEANCCHWLIELDAECVCEMLVHLPVFLARPAHQYTIMVDDSCNVTYTCGGRITP